MLSHANDLEGVGATGCADRFSNREDNEIAMCDDALVDEDLFGLPEEYIPFAVLLRHKERIDASIECHLIA